MPMQSLGPEIPPREQVQCYGQPVKLHYLLHNVADAKGYSMRDGVIYVAQGAGYLDLAIASAQSLREVSPGLPIDIYSDLPVPVDLLAGAPFDKVHRIPDLPVLGKMGRAKIACMPLSRFERTLFLDCDTLVVKPLGDLFAVLDRFELALAHDVRRVSALVREGFAEDTPYAFPQLNTGVLLYRRSQTMQAFFAEWARRYREAGRARDQITFKDLIWASDIRFYVLPPEFNLRRVTVMDAWEPLDALPTIIHSHRLLQHLQGRGGRVRTLAEVLRLEREALMAEWAALGLPAKARLGEDPSARFRMPADRMPADRISVDRVPADRAPGEPAGRAGPSVARTGA